MTIAAVQNLLYWQKFIDAMPSFKNSLLVKTVEVLGSHAKRLMIDVEFYPTKYCETHRRAALQRVVDLYRFPPTLIPFDGNYWRNLVVLQIFGEHGNAIREHSVGNLDFLTSPRYDSCRTPCYTSQTYQSRHFRDGHCLTIVSICVLTVLRQITADSQ